MNTNTKIKGCYYGGNATSPKEAKAFNVLVEGRGNLYLPVFKNADDKIYVGNVSAARSDGKGYEDVVLIANRNAVNEKVAQLIAEGNESYRPKEGAITNSLIGNVTVECDYYVIVKLFKGEDDTYSIKIPSYTKDEKQRFYAWPWASGVKIADIKDDLVAYALENAVPYKKEAAAE